MTPPDDRSIEASPERIRALVTIFDEFVSFGSYELREEDLERERFVRKELLKTILELADINETELAGISLTQVQQHILRNVLFGCLSQTPEDIRSIPQADTRGEGIMDYAMATSRQASLYLVDSKALIVAAFLRTFSQNTSKRYGSFSELPGQKGVKGALAHLIPTEK